MDGKLLSDLIGSIRIGDTGSAYVINGEGTTIADPVYENVLSKEDSFDDAQDDKSLQRLTETEKHAIAGDSSCDVANYAYTVYFWSVSDVCNNDNWALRIYAERQEFMLDVYQSILLCASLSLLFLIAGIALVIFFANNITRPIKEMKKTVDEIDNGNYDVNVSYQSTNEIGMMAEGLCKMI